MMDMVFLSFLNRGMAAFWLIMAVLLLRLLLGRAPRWSFCVLWAVVAVRLVSPFALESGFSLLPSARLLSPAVAQYSLEPTVDTGIPEINGLLNAVVGKNFAPSPGDSANPLQIWLFIGGILWSLGVAVMLCYGGLASLRLHRRVEEAVLLQDNVYLCDRISSPFILGAFQPKIYLPSAIEKNQLHDVLAHERAHIERKDYWWKPLAYLLLALYWFHPLVWLAFVLFCRDIEHACDEKVIKNTDMEGRKRYAEVLVSFGLQRRMAMACPLAFGEAGVKDRVKSVLAYRWPAQWFVVVVLIIFFGAGVCFLTDPRKLSEEQEAFLHQCIMEYNQGKYYTEPGFYPVEDHQILGIKRRGKDTIVYAWVMYGEYSLSGGRVQEESGGHVPAAITISIDGESYSLAEYWEPENGAYYTDSLHEKFPISLWIKAADDERYSRLQASICGGKAAEWYS